MNRDERIKAVRLKNINKRKANWKNTNQIFFKPKVNNSYIVVRETKQKEGHSNGE